MLLPDPQRRGEIHFVFAKSMAYGTRMTLIIMFLLSGFATQLLLLDRIPELAVLIGAALLFVASMFGIVKGYTNNPGNLGTKREWRAGDKEQLLKIIDVSAKSKSWDHSVIDITCGTGCLVGMTIAVIISLLVMGLFAAGNEWLAIAVGTDAAVLLFPSWVTGVRRILTNAPLTIKVQNLLHVYSVWEASKRDDEKMMVQMEVVKSEQGEMPTDAKLILQMPALGESFFGVQTQVVLNNVQGADFPYMYCVLVAKADIGMKGKLGAVQSDADRLLEAESKLLGFFSKKPLGIHTEWMKDGGMDILVIRQATTKETGYHTDPVVEATIFDFARQQARKLSATVGDKV